MRKKKLIVINLPQCSSSEPSGQSGSLLQFNRCSIQISESLHGKNPGSQDWLTKLLILNIRTSTINIYSLDIKES